MACSGVMCPGEDAGEVNPVGITDSGQEIKQVSKIKKRKSWLLGCNRDQIPQHTKGKCHNHQDQSSKANVKWIIGTILPDVFSLFCQAHVLVVILQSYKYLRISTQGFLSD